ncbi:hypothetical protein IFM89_000837, partial [Coptis chinensis]
MFIFQDPTVIEESPTREYSEESKVNHVIETNEDSRVNPVMERPVKLMADVPRYLIACLHTGRLALLAILVSAGIVLQILACALYNNWWPMLTGTNIYMLSLGDFWSSSTIDLYLHRRREVPFLVLEGECLFLSRLSIPFLPLLLHKSSGLSQEEMTVACRLIANILGSGNPFSHRENSILPVSGQSSKLVSAALRDVNTKEQEAVFPPRHNTKEALTEVDKLEVTLELLADKEDFGTPMPSTVNLSIFGSDPPLPTDSNGGVLLLDSSWNAAENRF